MPGRNSVSRPPAILIVEDRSAMRLALNDVLHAAFPGCAILEAADGASGMQLCAEHRPQLVLMDIGLPDSNGIELAARIRETVPEVSVIVISHFNAAIYIEKALNAGACAYIVKDDLLSELVPAVSKALGTPARAWR